MIAVRAPRAPVGIKGLGAYLPQRCLTNVDLAELGSPVTDAWVRAKTGITRRHVAADHEAMSDLVVPAVREALRTSGVAAADVDALVVSGDNHDAGGVRLTSAAVATALGLRDASCMDQRFGCPGSVASIHAGVALVAGGLARFAVAAAAEVNTRAADWTDRTSVWFGDAAAAAVLSPCGQGTGVLYTALAGSGRNAEILEVPAGGSREPTTFDTVAAGRHVLHMDGRAVFPWAVGKFVETVRALTTGVGIDLDEVAAIVPHQANLRILEAGAEALGVTFDRLCVNINRRANTGSPATLLALSDALADGRVSAGDLVVLVGFGGGLAWGGQLVRLNGPDDFLDEGGSA